MADREHMPEFLPLHGQVLADLRGRHYLREYRGLQAIHLLVLPAHRDPGSTSRVMNMYALPRRRTLRAVLAGVAVFLLVAAVELQQVLRLFGEVVHVRRLLRRQAPAKIPARLFHRFHGRKLRLRSGRDIR